MDKNNTRNNTKNNTEEFKVLLDQGANVDSIFKVNTNSKKDPYEEIDESLTIIQKKLYGIESLFELINSNLGFDEMISKIMNIFALPVRSEAASFLEYDYDNDCFFFRAVSGKSSQDLLKVTVPAGAGIVGKAAETRTPIIMSRLEDASFHLKSIGSLIGFEARDVIAIPIMIRGHMFGVVELLNPVNTKIYTNSDFEILESLSLYASKIIENRLILAAYGSRAAAQLESSSKSNRAA